MNIFERAARAKLRFGSYNGLVSSEDLFDMGLPELDEVAKRHHKELESSAEISFISKSTPENAEAKLRMEIIKHVIASKLADKERGETTAARNAERARIKELMAARKNSEDSELSMEELEAKMAALEEAD